MLLPVQHSQRKQSAQTGGTYITADPVGLEGGFNLFTYVENDPVNFIDPWGLLVVGAYNQQTGILGLHDLDTGESAYGQFHSGNPAKGYLPIPNGTYDIVEQAGNPDFYRLEPVDNLYGDDKDQRTGHGLFRLHYPGNSRGCVTSKDWDQWKMLKSFIDSTTTDNIKVRSKSRYPFANPLETVRRFGRIRVIGSY